MVTAWSSYDGVSWNSLGNAAIPLKDPLLVGLTVANEIGQTEFAYAVFDQVQIGPPPSVPLSITRSRNNNFLISLPGLPGWTNGVETSSDLVKWTPWTNYYNGSGVLLLSDPVVKSTPQRFYRAFSVSQ